MGKLPSTWVELQSSFIRRRKSRGSSQVPIPDAGGAIGRTLGKEGCWGLALLARALLPFAFRGAVKP